MPIPTDTYWNIKKLNWVFAISSVLLMAVTAWSIKQDYEQEWRVPQKQGKVWEAALVEEKIDSESTPEKEQRLRKLDEAIAAKQKELDARKGEIDNLQAQIRKLVSDQAHMEFEYNTLKANVGVDESQLQDAISAKETEKADKLRAKLAEPRKKLAEDTEALFAKKTEVAEAREKLRSLTADLDALNKQKIKLTSDQEALRKKLESLDPDQIPSRVRRLMAKSSALGRQIPLLQFVNPSEKVQQVVLPDIRTSLGGVKEVETIDRCITCHVNIAKKEFAEANVLAYLEEQVGAARNLKLAEQPSARATDPLATKNKPGAVAMPEFWHLWAVRVAPEQVRKPAMLTRLSTLAKTVGPGKVTVKVDGKTLESFSYVPDPAKKDDAASAALDQDTRDRVIVGVIKAWIGLGSKQPATVGRVSVTIAESTDEKTAAPSRLVAMKYVEDLKSGMTAALSPEKLKLLNDRYRRALVAEANVTRKKQGLRELDPSPVMLAHPRLDLYVDIDSKHSFEAVGCTSCHDGSGQETNFVVAAHTPRPIWVDQATGASVLSVQLDAAKAPKEHHGEDLSSMLGAVYPHDEVVPSLGIHLNGDGHGAKPQAATAPSTKPVEHVEVAPEEAPVDSPPVPYFDPVTGATGRAVSQMEYWKRTYEPNAPRSFALVYHEWDWPMRPPRYLQANCVRCHQDVNSIKDEAPKVFEGRSLFINQGCVNCHQMDSVPAETPPKEPSDVRLIVANGQRKVGTDLRNINAKLSPAYINTWIWAPKAFRPSTKMPHFFMLENNSSDEELRRTRQETRAITEYLMRTATKHEHKALPAGGKGSAEAGKTIFASIGCQGCHTNLNDDSGQKRGGKVVTIAENWIVTDLVKSGKLADAGDAKAQAAKAAELYDHMSYNERQLYITENLAPDYLGTAPKYPDGTPKPLFQHHGPELSGIGTKLTSGRTVEQARAWLFNWVKDPRHYSEYTVMPQFRLSDQQALDLTEYLLAQKRTNSKPDDSWKAELTPVDTPKLIELTAQFLRSRFSANVATKKADEDAELTALAADALTTAENPTESAKAQAAAMSKDERRLVFLGKKLISHYGCMSCHAINGAESLSSPCANLSDWGQKGIDKLDFGYIDHHKLDTLKKDDHGNPLPASIPMVNGLSERSSHLVGAEWRANFADGHVAKPQAVNWPHVGHSRTDWITQKLKNTRVYDRGKVLLEPNPKENDPGKPYDKLKMPTFYLNDREIDAIVTFVISNRDRLISTKLARTTMNEPSQRVARGRQLMQKFNCTGCHQVENNAPSVHQFYKADELTTKAPPSLRGEGNKIQHTWLFNFLKHVEPLRPLIFDGIRMPSFPILDEEATDIAAFFAAQSQKEAKELNTKLEGVRKYVTMRQEAAMKPVATTLPAGSATPQAAKIVVEEMINHAGALIAAHQFKAAAETLNKALPIATAHKLSEQVGATTKPVADRIKSAAGDLTAGRVPSSIAWPGDDWYTRPEYAIANEALRRWALTQKQISELQLDPTKNRPDEIARNMRTVKFKAEFTAELYDAPYPFVDTPRPEISQERFKKGEALFYEMQCLKCHVLGDPTVAGAQANPTAPNLDLTHRRLQRRWVRRWVQEPPIIQVGTAMPPFLTGLAIFDIHGQAWPRSQGVTEAEAQRIEKIYGADVEEQANLVLDFLYAAGVRNYTGIQPATPAAPTSKVVAERNPAAGVKPTQPPTATQPLLPGDASKNTAAEAPGAPSPESPKDTKTTAPTAPKPEAPKAQPKAEEKKPAESAKPQAGGSGASVTGTVKLEGNAPQAKEIDMSGVKECAAHHSDPVADPSIVADDKGNLANVVVYVSSGYSGSSEPPAEPAVLDQKGCMYEPHVLPVMVGQKIVVKNSDEFLHNVHSLASVNPPFNFGQPTRDEGKPIEPMKASEIFRVKCDVHPWMSAYILALENPYFGVSKADGSFSITNLPPGEYTLTAWHEQLGTKEIPVKVEAGKPAEVKVSFAAP